MKNIIEEFFYGNIEPQELNTHLTPKLRSKLKEITQTEEKLQSFLHCVEENCIHRLQNLLHNQMLGRKYRNQSLFLLCFVTIFMEKKSDGLNFFTKNRVFSHFCDEVQLNCIFR